MWKVWKVSQVILLIYVHGNVAISEQEHNVTKREIDPQIIGGSPRSMPSAVLIMINLDENTTNSCAGTILSEEIVLSAGHCFDAPGSYANVTTIVAGVSDLRNYLTGAPNIAQVFNVKQVIIHPHYHHVDGEPWEKEELIWDLAIIKLNSKMTIETNPNMEIAKLPPPGMQHIWKKVRVGGWGRHKPYSGVSVIHQTIDLMINSDEKCSDTYDVGEFLPSQMFCAGERGMTTCRGDSGAAAVYIWNNKPIIIGVLSFGTKGCKTAAVFQRVEKSLTWIIRETSIRPAYEIFEDDLLYNEAMAVCRKGWHKYEKSNKCYRYFTTRTSWLKAQTDCRNHGGDLASIENQAISDFITGTVVDIKHGFHAGKAYIGGRQFAENGYGGDSWDWIDGKTKFGGFTNWMTPMKDEGDENCMSMFVKNDKWLLLGHWNDVRCNRDNWFPYICSIGMQ